MSTPSGIPVPILLPFLLEGAIPDQGPVYLTREDLIELPVITREDGLVPAGG